MVHGDMGKGPDGVKVTRGEAAGEGACMETWRRMGKDTWGWLCTWRHGDGGG